MHWRADLDALQFPVGEGRSCFIHRLAFRKFLGRTPTPGQCLQFAWRYSAALKDAAEQRCANLRDAGHGWNFHLTSRDIARNLDPNQGSAFVPESRL